MLLKLYLGGMGKGERFKSAVRAHFCHCPVVMLCSHLPTRAQLSSACNTSQPPSTKHNTMPGPPQATRNTTSLTRIPPSLASPTQELGECPLDLGLLFYSIWNQQKPGLITWPRETLGTDLAPLPSPICETNQNQPLSFCTAVPSSRSSSRVRLLLGDWFQVRHPQKGLLGNAPRLSQPAPGLEPFSWGPHSEFALENFPSPSGFSSGKTVRQGALSPLAKE